MTVNSREFTPKPAEAQKQQRMTRTTAALRRAHPGCNVELGLHKPKKPTTATSKHIQLFHVTVRSVLLSNAIKLPCNYSNYMTLNNADVFRPFIPLPTRQNVAIHNGLAFERPAECIMISYLHDRSVRDEISAKGRFSFVAEIHGTPAMH